MTIKQTSLISLQGCQHWLVRVSQRSSSVPGAEPGVGLDQQGGVQDEAWGLRVGGVSVRLVLLWSWGGGLVYKKVEGGGGWVCEVVQAVLLQLLSYSSELCSQSFSGLLRLLDLSS